MFRQRHRWLFLRLERGPRGGWQRWSTCARCGLESSNQTWSRARVPVCDGGQLWDPRTDLWLAQLRELNRPAPPPDRPLLADLGEWWG